MTALRPLLAALLFAAAPAHAQNASPAEITFWETVRDSRNPAELEAYLQSYPNGVFAPIARARLASLAGKPAPQSPPAAKPPVAPAVATAPSSVTSTGRVPRVGDVWTYRFSQVRLRGEYGVPPRPPAIHTVRVSTVEDGRVVDTTSVDGGQPVQVSHQAADGYLVTQGVSVFSPYLLAFGDAKAGRIGSIAIFDASCSNSYSCRASGRFAGTEGVTVGQSRFTATKVIIEEEWRASGMGGGWQQMRMTGGRTLAVWYVPELRRAVKYSSRPTVGDLPPVESNFDLELISYELK